MKKFMYYFFCAALIVALGLLVTNLFIGCAAKSAALVHEEEGTVVSMGEPMPSNIVDEIGATEEFMKLQCSDRVIEFVEHLGSRAHLAGFREMKIEITEVECDGPNGALIDTRTEIVYDQLIEEMDGPHALLARVETMCIVVEAKISLRQDGSSELLHSEQIGDPEECVRSL